MDEYCKQLPPGMWERCGHLFTTLGRNRVFFVQLYCEIEELERREAAREDRPPGLARRQFDAVYSFNDYDLWIDSTIKSVDKCVKDLCTGLSKLLLVDK